MAARAWISLQGPTVTARRRVSQPMVMTIEQRAVVVVQVHAAAQTVAEHLTVGTLSLTRPLAVAEGLEAILPHLPEAVAVDIPLVVVRPDGRTPRNIPIDADRGDRNPRGTLVEVVTDLCLVIPKKTLAGVAGVDPPLAAPASCGTVRRSSAATHRPSPAPSGRSRRGASARPPRR